MIYFSHGTKMVLKMVSGMSWNNCYNCKNLDTSKKKPGAYDGCLYYCKKNKMFVNPAKYVCANYTKGDRDYLKDDKIYEDGKKYYDDATPIWVYAIILVILLVLGLILGVFH